MSSDEQAGQESLTPPRWGEHLRAGREAQVMSEAQVAAQLNLPEEYIRILESGNAERLPSLVFARGYVRTYARMLKLDDDGMVAEFDQSYPDSNPGKGRQIKSVTRVRQQARVNDPVVRLFTWLFVFGIIGLTFWWWQTQSGSALVGSPAVDSVAPNTAPEPVQSNEDGTLVLPKLSDSGSVETVNDAAAEGAASEAEPQYLTDEDVAALQGSLESQTQTIEQAAAEETAVSDNGAIAVAAQQGLEIQFRADCWVSVRDGNGKKLVSDLRRQGQSLNIDGTAPLQVILGAADAVASLTFNGQQVDLQPYSHENVVKLTLPLTE